MKPYLFPTILAVLAATACSDSSAPSNADTTPTTFTVVGDSTAIATTLDDYRTALGGALHAPAAPADTDGRREINWDGVPAALTGVDNFPGDFFNVTSTRGAVFTTAGTGFRVDSVGFGAINAGLAAQFKAFSPKKLFMPVGSNAMNVFFDVVHTQNPGLVKGFGVVFSDVDRTGSTRVTFYDKNDAVLKTLTAPARTGAQQFSFVGAVFPSAIVHRVIIISGDAALTAASVDISTAGNSDLVSMDDFVYGEPQPEN